MKSEPNVYYFAATGNYVLVYVDDLIVLGPDSRTLFNRIKEKVLVRSTGELTKGATIPFLGRRLRRVGIAINFLPVFILKRNRFHWIFPADEL